MELSIRAGGIYKINSRNLSIQDEIGIAYKLIRLSADYEIGLLLGGNSTFSTISCEGNDFKQTSFTLTDDPLDINAECLFSGDGIEIVVGDMRVDRGERLAYRMQKLQSFFENAFAIESIMSFELNINIETGDSFETLSVRVNDFTTLILKLYEQEDNWTPSVQLIINRN